MKEIIANGELYFTASSHFQTRISFKSYARCGRGSVTLLIISTCFAWCPLTSINEYGDFTARAHVNHLVNAKLFLRLYTPGNIV